MKHAFFTPRWIITTLLVIVAVAVMIRLGFWQLDRLHQRTQSNALIQAQISAPLMDLNQVHSDYYEGLPGMEYRPVVVRGVFDPQNEVILRNQVEGNMPGYHLLTPLHIDGKPESVLIDRGFIGLEDAQPAARAKYALPGTVTVKGVIALPHVPRYFGVPDPTLTPNQSRLDAWNAVNLERIQKQISYSLLPVYIRQNDDSPQPGMPIAHVETPDLSEGPHLGYAGQWFSFAAILGLGYPYFVRKQLGKKH